jgi:hypothetical protein
MTKEGSNDKIYYAMKSLHRYFQLKELNAPEILFETERVLLKERFGELTADEMHHLRLIWPSFFIKQTISNEIDDRIMSQDMEEFLNSVN